MTSRTIARTVTATTEERFPDYPPRDDMQNFLHLSRPSHMTSLERFFASTPGVSVVSEVPVSQRYGDYARVRIPDLMVSFDSDLDLVVEHNGYAIDRQGGPPDFVLEVASVSTARRDEDEKRRDYESFGIPEVLALRSDRRRAVRSRARRRPTVGRQLPPRTDRVAG